MGLAGLSGRGEIGSLKKDGSSAVLCSLGGPFPTLPSLCLRHDCRVCAPCKPGAIKGTEDWLDTYMAASIPLICVVIHRMEFTQSDPDRKNEHAQTEWCPLGSAVTLTGADRMLSACHHLEMVMFFENP